MYIIKQGTTPTFICSFDPDDASVSDISSAVFSVTNEGTTVHHMLEDLTVNALANTISYCFSQEETLAMKEFTDVYLELHVLLNDKRECAADIKALCRNSQYKEVLE